jgi:hypothetical protein
MSIAHLSNLSDAELCRVLRGNDDPLVALLVERLQDAIESQSYSEDDELDL